jgi:hypothetical protein
MVFQQISSLHLLHPYESLRLAPWLLDLGIDLNWSMLTAYGTLRSLQDSERQWIFPDAAQLQLQVVCLLVRLKEGYGCDQVSRKRRLVLKLNKFIIGSSVEISRPS